MTDIQRLASLGSTELHVYLEDFNDIEAFAHYNSFAIASEMDNFMLTISGYTGNAGDSLSYHNGQQFTTYDRDNDADGTNCAERFGGAWWYKTCHNSNLNGRYYSHPDVERAQGLIWFHFRTHDYSLKYVTMKIKRT